MRRVIVTGGTGFIGSWLIDELLKNGIEVTAIVRDAKRLLPTYLSNNRCCIIERPLDNMSVDFFPQQSYDAFYHLSWDGVSAKQKNTIDVQLSNLSLSMKALEICNELRCKRFIAAGTVAEYAFCTDIIDVNAKQTPKDIYGAAKTAVYYFLDVRAKQLKQPFNWVVIPSTFGERENDNHIIAYTIRSLLKKEKPQYGDLEQMWDFLYVEDVVKAMRLIGEKGKAGKIYGIGSGNYKPLRCYIETIRDLINPSMELGIGEIPAMSTQCFSSCVNIYDLIKDTGFAPTMPFVDGIKRTINWTKATGI